MRRREREREGSEIGRESLRAKEFKRGRERETETETEKKRV